MNESQSDAIVAGMTQVELRRLILKALCTDEWLFGQLVLKGGNALALAYEVGDRTSLDLDFSIERDFDDLDGVGDRIEVALKKTFEEVGIVVFDFQLTRRPEFTDTPWWGGYEGEFKLISLPVAEALQHKSDDMRRQAITIDPGSQRRKYSIEISKFEYVGDFVERDLGGFDVRVYSPVLLAAEKLRALLQQHPDYAQIPTHSKRSRARDLYDIWAISDYFSVMLDSHLPTVAAVFEAKRVDMKLLARFVELKALHFASWSDVENSVARGLEAFDFYFDFVASIARNLYSQWVENSP